MVHKQSATIFTWLSPKKRCKTVTSGGLSDEYQMSWEKEVCRRRLNCLPSPDLNQYPSMKWGFSEETDIVCFRLCDMKLELPATSDQSASSFKEWMTPTCTSSFIYGVVQLYLYYDSFTHLCQLQSGGNIYCSLCSTCVVSMVSVLVFCCMDHWFSYIQACQQSSGTPEVLSETRPSKFICTHWFSHT